MKIKLKKLGLMYTRDDIEIQSSSLYELATSLKILQLFLCSSSPNRRFNTPSTLRRKQVSFKKSVCYTRFGFVLPRLKIVKNNFFS